MRYHPIERIKSVLATCSVKVLFLPKIPISYIEVYHPIQIGLEVFVYLILIKTELIYCGVALRFEIDATKYDQSVALVVFVYGGFSCTHHVAPSAAWNVVEKTY